MRRRLLVAAIVIGTAVGGASPVFADGAADSTSVVRWVDRIGGAGEAIVNSTGDDVPSPGGWQPRSVCAGDENVDRAWCVYFPFPL
ncbi:MAG TPA: hypothetical protein VMZ22_12345 [Acidimicrobiales bacterium]|nr:hypothetical protein [Acidimicrobiales bacterium]